MNQISSGLISEAMFQLTLAMGNVDEQMYVLEAKANITKTWEDLFQEVKVVDRNQPLDLVILYDASHPIVAQILFIY